MKNKYKCFLSAGFCIEPVNHLLTKVFCFCFASSILLSHVSAQAPCSNYPMVGYAAVSGEGYTTTTGGAGGQVTTVTTLEQLHAFAKSREKNTTPQILYISGKITNTIKDDAPITIKNGANISIIGINNAELIGCGLIIRDYSNVIIRNLKIHEVISPHDGLALENVNHGWIDHNEFYSLNGPGIGVDTYDGLFDIKNGSRFITVSWNVLHDHKKVMLIGHTENNGAEDSQFRITIHHNYFYNNDGRNPSLRFGAVHLYNNYFKIIYDYGIAVRQGAHALIENNVYEQVVTPIATDKFEGVGFACERGNVFTNVGPSSITQTDCAWWNATNLPYKYTLDAAPTAKTLVVRDAGMCNNNATPKQTLPMSPVVTSVEEEEMAKLFNIFPNPASHGESKLEFTLLQASVVKVTLLNQSGKIVELVCDKVLSSGAHDFMLNTASLPSGLYLCHLVINNKTISKKLVVHNK